MIDIFIIFANALIILNSFQNIYDLSIDNALIEITLNMKYALPLSFQNWLDGYLNFITTLFLSIKDLVSKLNFGTLITSINITCSGSQGPAKVLSNLALGIFTIIIFEMFFVECLNVTIKRTMESIRNYLTVRYGKFKGGFLGLFFVIGK